MLMNYVFVTPVKDNCGKTLVLEYIYKISLPFGRTEKFLWDNGTSFINEHWKNLARALSFKHIQYSPRNPRANGRIENVHNFLKRTMKKIRHGVTCCYYSSIPVTNEPHLASRESKSCLISGGDSS